MTDSSEIAEWLGRVRAAVVTAARDAGRDPDEIDLAYHSAWYDDQAERTLPDGTRRMFTGAPDSALHCSSLLVYKNKSFINLFCP